MADALEDVLAACPESGALSDYFASLPLEALARFWPACMAESLSVEWRLLPEGLIGNILRASLVVAHRLNGVTYMTQQQIPARLAQHIKPTHDMRTPAVGTTPLPTTKPVADDSPFSVSDGPMPAAAKGMRADPLIEAIKGLKPGKHIAIPASKIKKATLTSKVNRAKKAGGDASLKFYIAEDGRFIVYIGAGR